MSKEDIHYKGGVMHYCKSPDPFSLTEVFKNLLDPPGRYYFVYFSDDSCLSVRIGNEVHVFNVDISKCDASHGPRIFEALVNITPELQRDDMQRVVEQCSLPFKVTSVTDRKKKLVLKPKVPVLYSGSTITTTINNLANIAIAVSVVEGEFPEDKDEVPCYVSTRAELAGYIVTVESCEQKEDIQFLKYSPAIDTNGNIRPLLNLGVLLRASGTCKGDLPGRGSIRKRAEEFQGALLRGMFPNCSFPLLESMKKKSSSTTRVKIQQYVDNELRFKVDKKEHYPHHNFSMRQATKRYKLTELDLHELCEWGELGFMGSSAQPFVTKILEKDYGLRALSWCDE